MTATHGPLTFADTIAAILARHGWVDQGIIPSTRDMRGWTHPDRPGHQIALTIRDHRIDFGLVSSGSRSRWIVAIEQVEAFAAGKPIPTMVVTEDDHTLGRKFERTLRITYKRSEVVSDRWVVCRADNGRRLGWLSPNLDYPGTWNAYVDEDAFRGTGPDDRGDLLDRVGGFYVEAYSDGSGRQRPITEGAANREDAATAIFTHLVRHRAPAAGFHQPEGHYGVTTWASRRGSW
jgi:hypothetical protein